MTRQVELPATVHYREEGGFFHLSNGIVHITVHSASGRLVSLLYGERHQLMGPRSGRANSGGYWSLSGSPLRFGKAVKRSVARHLTDSGDEAATVSILTRYDGNSAVAPIDIEFRYTLVRGVSGVFVSSTWIHGPDHPAFDLLVGRFALKLNPNLFDHFTVDQKRRRVMASPADWENGVELNVPEARRLTTGPFAGEVEHKYDYSARLFDIDAYGWSSTQEKVGIWMINPSHDYMGGGPMKVELTGHLGGKFPVCPTLLNVWKGPHYGGTSLRLEKGEPWRKCIGPFFVYCNNAGDLDGLWVDALREAKAHQSAWPYSWAAGPDYPIKNDRGAISGKISIVETGSSAPYPIASMLVGVAAPPYSVATPEGQSRIDWQLDAKFYQYWARAGSDGSFRINNVRRGRYTLYAIADGILGELRIDGITLDSARLDLGELVWKPYHFGTTLWEIGPADRTATKFRHGDHYWKWGLYYDYVHEFPNDVHFTIGKSSCATDWNYAQPGRIDGDIVAPSTWWIYFDVPEPLCGVAALRLAFVGSRAPSGVHVLVNGEVIGGTGPLPDTGVMHRDGIQGLWFERVVIFDASLLQRGTNSIGLRLPATRWSHGVLYDCVRLEWIRPTID